MIGARPPGNQLGGVRRTVVETHSRERTGQDRIGSNGSAIFQLVDDDFCCIFARGLLDDGLDGLADQLLVVWSGPHHEAARFRVDRDSGLRGHAGQKHAESVGVGRADGINDELRLVVFARACFELLECRCDLFVFCLVGPGDDGPGAAVVDELHGGQQFPQKLKGRHWVGLAKRIDLHGPVCLFQLLGGKLSENLLDHGVIGGLGPCDQFARVFAGRKGHLGEDTGQ